ncbi:CCR4-NOT transcription complex subunit 10 isoform X2 [Dendrobates tinctorius]|uniref:CCR4-NOT transcription complex subunit 10 isoform X2 n=1 Tax=Dendrobates tinctorius TaxID=92724 RepID=UPI003CC9F30C
MAADKAGEQSTEKNEGSANCSGVSDQEKELSRSSFQTFTAGNYEACLQHLGDLKEINKDDYKIMLNIAVTEFYKSDQSSTDNLKQTLNHLRNEVHAAVDEMDSLDDVENSMLYYNQAVILYYLRQHLEAIAIGEKLYQFIEPFEEKFAHAVCFLLVDLYLLTYQTEKALHLLVVLEKLILQGNNNKNGKNNETNNNSNNKEALNLKSEGGAQLEVAKSKVHQCKVRAYIQMKSLKACKREIKSVMNTSGNSAPSLFLKSNFEYLRGNYRKAVKLLNSSNISEHPGFMKTGECVRCMFWNNLGCIHFAMGKHNLGLFYFKKAIQENDNACAVLSTTDQGRKFSGRPMCTLLTNKRYELLYNCGIQLLHIGRPLAAFECLIEAVQVYHSNPRLWLRLAECCIAANKGTPEQETKGLPSKKGIVQSVVGQGYHRKIVLASQSVQNLLYNDGESSAIPVASMEFAAICLRNAFLLLPEDQQDGNKENSAKSNSQMGNTDSSGESTEACSNKNHEGDKFLPAPPSAPLKRQELENLRCSVLACSAYVALALGDNLMALNHAEKLLQQPRLSGSLKFLGHLYAAEALISLDRISDAITHLNPENVTDVSLGVLSHEQEQASDKGDNEPMESVGKQTPQCYPSSVTSARTMMLFNLGSAYCLRSEYDKARKCLHQAASMIHPKEIPPEAILLAVYLELQNGNTQLALQIIKRNQLLPSVKMMTDLRKKPLYQPIHQPMQPIQMPTFTTVQRK